MKIALFLVSFVGALFIAAGFSAPAAAYNPLGQACQSLQNGQTNVACNDAANQGTTKDPVVQTIAKTTRVLSLIVGFAAVIMIVISGLNMITSAGNPEGVKGARSRLTSAVVGLIIASLAWVISSFVINHVTVI